MTKTKLEIIEETKNYYAEDTGRRAKSGFNCVYYDSSTKNCCAVGIRLRNPKRYAHLTDVNVRTLMQDHNISIFKEEYRIKDVEFWSALQAFHDEDFCWKNDKGLTRFGEKKYQELLKKYKN